MEEELKEETLQSPEVLPVKKKKPWLMITLIVLIVIIFGAIGIFAYQNYLLKKQIKIEKNSPLAIPSITQITPTTIVSINELEGEWQSSEKAQYQPYESGQIIAGISIDYDNKKWIIKYKREHDESYNFYRLCFDFAPYNWNPSYNVGGDWMGWGGMIFIINNNQPNIISFINKNYPEYKDELVAEENNEIGNKSTFLVNKKENSALIMWNPRHVILGNKYSYEVSHTQDGENNFSEILIKEIYPNINID